MKLLIAEDDSKLLKTLKHLLMKNNYSVDGVKNGSDALDYAMSGEYDGLILDVMMPGTDGITLLRKLRENGVNTPALILSARTETYQKVEGLDAGADDYLAKPFSTAELLARIRAMLRRRDNFTPDLIAYKDLTLNRSSYELSYFSKTKQLSGKEFQVMEMLIERPSMIITTEQFLTHIWGWETNVDTSVVWVHISNIRKKLDSLGAPYSIRFVRAAGYVLEDLK